MNESITAKQCEANKPLLLIDLVSLIWNPFEVYYITELHVFVSLCSLMLGGLRHARISRGTILIPEPTRGDTELEQIMLH